MLIENQSQTQPRKKKIEKMIVEARIYCRGIIDSNVWYTNAPKAMYKKTHSKKGAGLSIIKT